MAGVTPAEAFKNGFAEKNIKKYYDEKIKLHPSVGMDRVTPKVFAAKIDEQIDIINRKVLNGTYNFTHYREVLIVKNAVKPPRKICIPTLRDKLTLTVLNSVFYQIFGNACKCPTPQVVIDGIINSMPNFTHFIKYDIKAFFSSINHELLLNTLDKKLGNEEILSLVKNAITTPAASPDAKSRRTPRSSRGVPEGLPVSNSIANLFMQELDEKYGNMPEIKYFRYVDDILILLNEKDFDRIRDMFEADIAKLDLKISDDKEDRGELSKGFTYLGYSVSPKLISVRESTVLKFERSLEERFKQLKNRSDAYIEWKINLKVTGCVNDNKKYGWIFFFSQINDLSLLYHFDDLVEKYAKRYFPKKTLKFKSFVRTYHEIKNALSSTKYIPNFHKYRKNDKKAILREECGDKVDRMSDEEIESSFKTLISKEIREFEKDVQNLS